MLRNIVTNDVSQIRYKMSHLTPFKFSCNMVYITQLSTLRLCTVLTCVLELVNDRSTRKEEESSIHEFVLSLFYSVNGNG